MRGFLVWLFFLLGCASALAQWPLTRAEKTNYNETSHYADVIRFLHDLQVMGAPISILSLGQSTDGRDMPLAIASFPPVATPAEARRLGKPIVFIQANIHAGEVEGKEAALMILRRLSQDGQSGLLGKMVLLVAPIYNIDGNEKWGPVDKNRPEQDGPPIVGVRANGQGLDLNRDAIKSESPENSGLLRHVYTTWDPDVMMDLHTTDGTRHGYELTYSPPLNPNTEAGIMRLARDIILPTVRRQIENRDKTPLFDYGNAEKRGDTTAWYTFGQEGRYCTNYVGLRNRIGILSEAVTYLPFKDRVVVTDKFVTAVLEYVAKHPRQIIDATRKADAAVVSWGQNPSRAPELGVRFGFDDRGEEEVLLEKKIEPRPVKRPVQIEKGRMKVYDRFKPTKTAKFPAAYLINSDETKVAELLVRHGVVVERLLQSSRMPVAVFTPVEVKVAERAFQNHKLIELNGSFEERAAEIAQGTFIVRTAQPLGILAFHILEPESLDGAVAWGFLKTQPAVGVALPIQKTFLPVKAPSERVQRETPVT